MLTFWLLAGLMLLVALALMLRPILRPRSASGLSIFDASVAIHRERLKNLKQQHADGILNTDELQQARQELEHTLLEETRGQDTQTAPAPPRPAKFTAAAILILLPALSLGLYAWLGSYTILQFLGDPTAMQELEARHPPRPEEVQRQIKNLKRRLRQVPDDTKALSSLAHGYMTLEQYDEAAKVFDRLIRKNGGTPELLVGYAEAASIANKMRFTRLARERLERSLELAPKHPKSLMLGALAAMQTGDTKLALLRWKTLLPMQQPGTQQARLISMLISRTEQGLNPGQAQSAVKSATENFAAVASARINVELSLSPALQEKITGSERVFVFARDAGGPPMPIAVKVLSAADLPTSVILDDIGAMPSARRLSSVEQVLVGARISFTGNATPSAGDLEGKSGPLRARDNPTLKLVIDSVRP